MPLGQADNLEPDLGDAIARIVLSDEAAETRWLHTAEGTLTLKRLLASPEFASARKLLAENYRARVDELQSMLSDGLRDQIVAEVEHSWDPQPEPLTCTSESGHNWGASFEGVQRCCVCNGTLSVRA